MRLSWFSLFLCLPLQAATYYAATNGVNGNPGTIGAPLTLSNALNSISSPAVAGDTIYVRGGTFTNYFTSTLVGTPGSKILVINYPNERPIIDGNYDGLGGVNNTFTILGSNVRFVGLEVMNSYATRIISGTRPTGIVTGDNAGPSSGIEVINCVVHDTGVGIFGGLQATNFLAMGNVIYNIGYQNVPPDRGHGHGIYSQNALPSIQTYKDNVVLNIEDLGAQWFDQGGAAVQGYDIEGNVVANSGQINDTTLRVGNYVGYGSSAIRSFVVGNNLSYHFSGPDTNGGIPLNFQFGNADPGSATNSDITFTNNYAGNGLMGILQFTNVTFAHNTNVTVDPNTILSYCIPKVASLSGYLWDTNTYIAPGALPFNFNGVTRSFINWQLNSGFDPAATYTSGNPGGTVVFTRTNTYQANRAIITVFNWAGTNSVLIDFTRMMAVGTSFQLRNAFDYNGTPPVSGVYAGGILQVPLTNLNVVAPIGLPAGTNLSPYFASFVLTPVVTSSNIANSCSPDDVQVAINAAAPGSTVYVPPGTCQYTHPFYITNHVQVITLGTVNIQDCTTNTSDNSKSAMVVINPSLLYPDYETRISGFTFLTGSNHANFFESGMINVGGQSWTVRIDGNTFKQGLNIGIGWSDVFGCIDHNAFVDSNFKQPMKIHHGNYGVAAGFGDGAWALPSWTNASQEDASAVYIENNVFTNLSGIPGLTVDADSGARYVARSNILDRVEFGGHGTESTQRQRGSRVKDIYNNIFVNNHGDSEVAHWRSGSGIAATNEIHNSTGAFTVRNYRMTSGPPPWRWGRGTNVWDLNNTNIFGTGIVSIASSLSMTDTNATWTNNQWVGYTVRDVQNGTGSLVASNNKTNLTIYDAVSGTSPFFTVGDTYEFRLVTRILDEVGRGAGALMSNSTPVINGIAQYPNEALDPVYQWNNTLNGGAVTMGNGGYYASVVGQEIVNGVNPNWRAFQYPHYLISGFTNPPSGPDPVIIVQPQNTTTLVGGIGIFSVTATGNSGLVYQWSLNGTPISGAVNSSYTTNGVSILANGNAYTVKVSDAAGSVLSTPGILTVTNAPVPPAIRLKAQLKAKIIMKGPLTFP